MAQVDFSRQEFYDWAREYDAQSFDEDGNDNLREETDHLYEQMRQVNYRDADGVLERISALVDAHGVEAVRQEGAHVDNYFYDIIATYVNMGDAYAETVLFDSDHHAFLLASYGGFLEQWEQEHAENLAAVCAGCGTEFNPDMAEGSEAVERGFEADLCDSCVRDRDAQLAPTWRPKPSYPLVALLRSVEGHLVAVHYMPDADMEYTLAFSVVGPDDRYYAAFSDEPSTRPWPWLVERFQTHDDYVVAGIGPLRAGVWQNGVATLEREQFGRLEVAMDAFFEAGMQRQPVATFLQPPLLWQAADVVGCVWHEERGEAAVECYVRPGRDGSAEWNRQRPGADARDLSIWSARTPELETLVEDGFVKWDDDDSVRRYLVELGIVRG